MRFCWPRWYSSLSGEKEIQLPITSRRQKAIQKLNIIIIARLTTENRPNIVSDLWRFDTTADWQMFRKDFEKCLPSPVADDALLRLQMHVTSLGYQKKGLPWFIELLDGSSKTTYRRLMGLDNPFPIPDDKQPGGRFHQFGNWTNQKKETEAKRRKKRETALAMASAGLQDESGLPQALPRNSVLGMDGWRNQPGDLILVERAVWTIC